MKLFGSKRGFTLVELMVSVSIIGVLTAVTVPSFMKATYNARAGACKQNQKVIFEATQLYAILECSSLGDIDSQAGRLTTLLDQGYIKSNKGYECPESGALDYDDYVMTFDGNGALTDVACQINDTDHAWPN